MCLAFLVILVGLQCGQAAFLESFTTNLEATPPTSTAPFLWAAAPKLMKGGRGPEDPSNPSGNHAFYFRVDEAVAAETVLMNWDVDTTELTFLLLCKDMYGCARPTAIFRLSWSDDGITWYQLWNRTVAQMTADEWTSYKLKVELPDDEFNRDDPIAFKWSLSASGECSMSFSISLDDITFPTIAPSADTYSLGKAPKAPMPSASVCAALSKYCTAGAGAPIAKAGGRRRMLAHA